MSTISTTIEQHMRAELGPSVDADLSQCAGPAIDMGVNPSYVTANGELCVPQCADEKLAEILRKEATTFDAREAKEMDSTPQPLEVLSLATWPNSLGPLKFGMTREEVERALCVPASSGQHEKAFDKKDQVWSYKLGLQCTFSGSTGALIEISLTDWVMKEWFRLWFHDDTEAPWQKAANNQRFRAIYDHLWEVPHIAKHMANDTQYETEHYAPRDCHSEGDVQLLRTDIWEQESLLEMPYAAMVALVMEALGAGDRVENPTWSELVYPDLGVSFFDCGDGPRFVTFRPPVTYQGLLRDAGHSMSLAPAKHGMLLAMEDDTLLHRFLNSKYPKFMKEATREPSKSTDSILKSMCTLPEVLLNRMRATFVGCKGTVLICVVPCRGTDDAPTKQLQWIQQQVEALAKTEPWTPVVVGLNSQWKEVTYNMGSHRNMGFYSDEAVNQKNWEWSWFPEVLKKSNKRPYELASMINCFNKNSDTPLDENAPYQEGTFQVASKKYTQRLCVQFVVPSSPPQKQKK